MGLVDGIEGESVFVRPFVTLFRASERQALLKEIEPLGDDRLLVIVSALAIEDRVDAALASFLPGYAQHLKGHAALATKVHLLRAARLVPPRLLSVADAVRVVRNEFAHELACRSLQDIEPKKLKPLLGLWRSYVCKRMHRPSDVPLSDVINASVFFCVVGLDLYTENIRRLRGRIENPAFADELRLECELDNERRERAIVSAGPISTEISGGLRVERYSDGLVRVAAADSPK